jgi:hypothetical protein
MSNHSTPTNGFKKGHKLAKGGSYPEKAGPKPAWWKEYCAKAVHSESRLRRLEHFLDKGEFHEFWEVYKFLAESAFGKASQAVALTADITQRRIIINMPANCPKEYLDEANAIESC